MGNALMLQNFLEKVKTELLNGQNILIVGHSHNLQILQMLLYGSAFEQGIEKFKLEHATPINVNVSLDSDNKLVVKERDVAISSELCRPML